VTGDVRPRVRPEGGSGVEAGVRRAGPPVRDILAVLREPYWLRMGLLVVLLSVACVFLGRWQWGRHEGKVAMAHQIDTSYDAAPVPLSRLLPDAAGALPGNDQWRPVRESGRYLPSEGVVVRNRPNADGEYGYEVVVPFRIDSGPVLLVDRGWIPNGASGARPDTIPPPPAGEVTIVARLRPSEPPGDSPPPPPGQAQRIEVPRLTAPLGVPAVTHAYAVLASEDPAPATAPAVQPRPDEDLGPHLAYAIQWWLGAVVVYVLLVVYARQEAQRRAGTDQGGRAVAGAARPAPSRRSGRRELTDEEWEDLADARVQAGIGDGVVGGRAGVDDHEPGAGAQRHVDE
jgi:cytochrome oxidase assembly protein ShyY1